MSHGSDHRILMKSEQLLERRKTLALRNNSSVSLGNTTHPESASGSVRRAATPSKRERATSQLHSSLPEAPPSCQTCKIMNYITGNNLLHCCYYPVSPVGPQTHTELEPVAAASSGSGYYGLPAAATGLRRPRDTPTTPEQLISCFIVQNESEAEL